MGAVRRLTLKDGPSFDEELTGFDDAAMKLRYKIIGEAPLPITDYDSTIQVLSTGPNKSTVVWRSSFLPKAGAKDDVVIESVTQLYLGGLQNLKQSDRGPLGIRGVIMQARPAARGGLFSGRLSSVRERACEQHSSAGATWRAP